MRIIQAPLSKEDIESLELGETVYLSGPIVTGRDEVHIRALEYLRNGKDIPNELKGSVLYHCGPIMLKKNNSWITIAAGPTTSARMNKLEPEIIKEFKIKAIIGKGGMSEEVSNSMKENGCVYLAATGGAAVSIAESLSNVIGVDWEDLGMAEALWKFNANKLGPLVVAIDSKGNNLYENVKKSLIRDDI